ncbi:MAG: hypothetical protein ACREDY_20760 [Bradyrhizobium sp.]
MKRTSVLLAIATLLAFAAAPAAAQSDQKPAIELKTHAAEISVTIDPKLKTYPGLDADLLAEGRRYVANARGQADAEYKTNRQWFKEDDRHWTYDLVFTFRSLVAYHYVSIVRDDGTFTGGAHPSSRTNTILWDATTRKRISIRPFLKETADNGPTMTALTKLARRAVAVQKLERWKEAAPDDERNNPQPAPDQFAQENPEIVSGVQPSLLKIGPISLAPSTEPGKSSGLTFHYSAYDVDAYAAGPYTVFVPFTAFKPYLSAQGLTIFGGERPEKDKDSL